MFKYIFNRNIQSFKLKKIIQTVNLRSIIHYQKFNFNIVTAAAGQQLTQGPPPKTKEQLKIERLLEQWPDFIKNASKDNLRLFSLKKNLEKIYKYHQGDKNYVQYDDLPQELYMEVASSVMGTYTTETISGLLQEYEGFLTDHMVVGKMFQIATSHKDLTDEFFTVIMPQVKETLKKADRGSGTTFFLAGYAAGCINLADKEFWEIFVKFYFNFFRSIK